TVKRHTQISMFFFQAEDGIRDFHVTGVQTCALPIYLPGFQLIRPGLPLEQCVALLQGTDIPAPGLNEVTFHVEQTPIHVPPPVVGGARYECMAPGLEGDDRESGTDITEPRDRDSVQVSHPGVPGVPQSRFVSDGIPVRRGPTPSRLPCCKHFDRVLARLHEALADATAEAPAIAKQVERLQNACLAGAVIPGQYIHACTRFDPDAVEAPEVADVQPGHAHRCPPGDVLPRIASRPDMPGVNTNVRSTWNIRGEEASPRGGIAHCWPPAPAPTSSHRAWQGSPAPPSAQTGRRGDS